ncbi:M23 family metallopeptidase [Arthrobacter sp. AB6]|uniref:M23 family metallopeptidase n=1 Tax=Arthrobacter sp. AB6 TaxID=2962570 RepID=UPI00288220D2|nr:M23 family metallopeptidase [Arthrobacter sp. AB6]MDT0193750.1 M23 family metallopeptidase [Arthrobacter sp. AB6]
MAKHLARAAARRGRQHRRHAARLAISGGTGVLAVLVMGLQANGSVPAAEHAPGHTSGGFAATAGQGLAAGTGVAQAAGSTLDAVSAPADASLTYSRSTVLTEAKKENGKLSAASTASQRPAAGTLMAPLEALLPSSPFGLRTSPITGRAGEFHWGLDFAASCGTRVHSADAGVVRAVGWHQWGGGNRVEVDHGNGLITTYNHLEGIGVRTGQSVQAGDVIAKVGTTGASTGCHLHFETVLNGSHTDPAKWTLVPLHSPDPKADITMADYRSADRTKPAPAWVVSVEQSRSHESAGHGHSHGPAEAGPAAVTSSPRVDASAPSALAPVPTTSPTVAPAPTATASPAATSSATATAATPSPTITMAP